MVLVMYLNEKVVDTSLLTIHKIGDKTEREHYIQGAVNALLEKWDDLIVEQDMKPRFYIKGPFPF